MNDSIGDRMKGQYEDRTRYALPRRTYTIIRVDGKAFHGLCRRLDRPFDYDFMARMDVAALAVCRELQGCRLAYVQSDEASFLLTDFEKPTTDALYDGNVQKIASISASLMTGAFNPWWKVDATAYFDARVFTIPDPVEVENYFIWRQQDATRNSIAMAAQALYSHKELHGKNTAEQQEMCFAKGVNWNDYRAGAKRGRVMRRVECGGWHSDEPPIFTQERSYLRGQIPLLDAWDSPEPRATPP